MFATLLSLTLLGAAGAEVKTSETPTTRLYVETTPAGATIKVDGKAQGTAPKVIPIPPGTRKMTVEVELDGRPSQRQELTIQGGRVTRLEFNFGPQAPEPKQAGSAAQEGTVIYTPRAVPAPKYRDSMTAPPSDSSAVPGVPPPGMYAVPEGGVDQLVKFIQTLSEYKPKTRGDDIAYRAYFRRAIAEAAEKILKLDKDPNSEACQAARFVLLANRVYALAQGDPQQQKKTLADVKAYLEEQVKKGQGEAGASLAISLGQTLEQMGEYQRAAEALKGFAEVTAKSGDASLSRATAELTRTAERLAAAAKEYPLEDPKLVLPPKGRLVSLDLRRQANMEIVTFDTSSGGGLAELPRGENTLAGVKFQVGPKVVQLASSSARDRPEKVEGIAVDRKIVRLYVLHSSQTSWVPGGTRVGEYRLHYEDGSSAVFPIVYGEDLRDWWCGDDHYPATRAKVVWTGNNVRSAQARNTLRLCLRVWENPHPEKKVTSLEYVSAVTRCAPFCVAITAEESQGAE